MVVSDDGTTSPLVRFFVWSACVRKKKYNNRRKHLQRMKRERKIEEEEDGVWDPIQIAFFNLLNSWDHIIEGPM